MIKTIHPNADHLTACIILTNEMPHLILYNNNNNNNNNMPFHWPCTLKILTWDAMKQLIHIAFPYIVMLMPAWQRQYNVFYHCPLLTIFTADYGVPVSNLLTYS
jgi:MFS superfamily sulfate permease-like transporter